MIVCKMHVLIPVLAVCCRYDKEAIQLVACEFEIDFISLSYTRTGELEFGRRGMWAGQGVGGAASCLSYGAPSVSSPQPHSGRNATVHR